MTKELRGLITEYNTKKDSLEERIKNATSAEEINNITSEIKDLKIKLKNQAEEENSEICFDIDGYAGIKNSMPSSTSEEGIEDFFKDKTKIYGGGNGVVSNGKLKILNSTNITKIYENKDDLDLGKYIKGALTGKWDNAANEMGQFKALSTSTGTVLIPQSLSAQILAKVMNKSLIYGSGVPILDMPSGNLTIAKVTKNPNVSFKGEGQLAAGVTFDSTKGTYNTDTAEFEGITLKSKTIYGICKVSDEVLNSAQNLTEVLTQAFSNALADGLDKACIYGSGSKNTDGSDKVNPEILGIANTSGINSIAAGGNIDTVHYTPFVKAVGAIRKNNGEPTTLGINSDVDTSLNLLTNTVNDPLGIPQVVSNLNRMVSNNLRNNLGTGNDESESLVYDPASMVIGQQVTISFQVSNQALDAFATGSTYFRIFSMIDLAVLRPEFITRITGLK